MNDDNSSRFQKEPHFPGRFQKEPPSDNVATPSPDHYGAEMHGHSSSILDLSLQISLRQVLIVAVVSLSLVAIVAGLLGATHRREVASLRSEREAALAVRSQILIERKAWLQHLVQLSDSWCLGSSTLPAPAAAIQTRCAKDLMRVLDRSEP